MCAQAYGAGVIRKIKKDTDCWWAGSVTLPEVEMLPRETDGKPGREREREKRNERGGMNGRFRAKSRLRSVWLRSGWIENTQMRVWRFHDKGWELSYNCSFSGLP